jgi:hypothetical protein
MERLKGPGIASTWDPNWRTNAKMMETCVGIPVGDDVRPNSDSFERGDIIGCIADDPKGDTNNKYFWDGSQMERLKGPGIASTWDPNWRTNAKMMETCVGIPVGNDVRPNSDSFERGDIIGCIADDPKGDTNNRYFWDGNRMERASATAAVAMNLNLNNSKMMETCVGIPVGNDLGIQWGSFNQGDIFKCGQTDPANDPSNKYRWDGQQLELFDSPNIAASWDPNYNANAKEVDCSKFTIGSPVRYKYENFSSGDIVQCVANDPKGNTNNVYRWDGRQLELLKSAAAAASWGGNWRQNKTNADCYGIPLGTIELGVRGTSDFDASCDDLAGANEDVSASTMDECANMCRTDQSSFPCGGFMWNGSTCKLFNNAWNTGVDVCDRGWSVHRFKGTERSDTFTASYDDMSGSYTDIAANVLDCKRATSGGGGRYGGFMHKGDTCRMFTSGASTGVDIQSSGWTAYRK